MKYNISHELQIVRYNIIKMKPTYEQQQQIENAVMALMYFLYIMAGACGLGLVLSIIKGICLLFGVQTNI